MSCQTVDYVRANQRAWSASAAHHVISDGYKALKVGFAQPGFVCLDDIRKQHLVGLGIASRVELVRESRPEQRTSKRLRWPSLER